MDKKAVIKDVLEWIYCIVIAVALALLIRYFIGTPTEVRQKSMFPTLKQGQRLILNRLPRTFKQEYKRGDIITFEAPKRELARSEKATYDYTPSNWLESFAYYVVEAGKTSYIKRVIALPGEHVKIADGKVYINGEELKEDYLSSDVVTEAKNINLEDFTVPDEYIFAMGDNRENSADCREFGCVPIEKVEGKVWIRIWPLNLFGKV